MFLMRSKLRDARAVGLYFSLLHPLSCDRLRDLRSLGREPPSINQGWGGGEVEGDTKKLWILSKSI